MTPRHPSNPQLAADLIEEITGKHDLAQMAATAAARAAVEEFMRAQPKEHKQRPVWTDAALLLALLGAVATAAVAIFQAQVGYGDHDTVISLRERVEALERAARHDKRADAPSPPSPVAPSK